MTDVKKVVAPLDPEEGVGKPVPTISVDEKIKQETLLAAQLDREAKQLALDIQKQTMEGLKLEQEVRKYHLKDLKATVANRDIKELQNQESREAQGRVFKQQQAIDLFRYSNCTHRKGGMAHARDMHVLTQGGDSPKYAVMKHQMINGDIWVRCGRCGRTWKPPVEKDYFFDKKGFSVAPKDGIFSEERFEQAKRDHREAVAFITNNTMSTSVLCRFQQLDEVSGKMVDAADVYRDNVSSTTLR